MNKAKAVLIKDKLRVKRKRKHYPETEPVVLGPMKLSKKEQKLVRMPLLMAAKILSQKQRRT